MLLKTQVKAVRLLREALLGHTDHLLPYTPDPKPAPQPGSPLQRMPVSDPEAQGVPSGLVSGLLRQLAALPQAGAHSLLLARHGRLIAQGWFAPYRPGVWHVTHSLCKSFTGTAVGLAIAEGRFGLEDPVAGYFPEYCSLRTSRRMRAVTVRHLLTMSSGITFNEIGQALETDWVRAIFESEVAFEPGSRFFYNSMNSYLLSALVQKTTGQNLLEYLRPRLFEPMGFGPLGWEKCPKGIVKGGWGMYLLPEDMLKFGQLYLQGGLWQGPGGPRQLLPAQWVQQATATSMSGPEGEYGLHIWTCAQDGSFLMNGMFGQYVAVFPRQDMVAVLTSGSSNFFAGSAAFTLLQKTLGAGRLSDRPLPKNRRAQRELAALCAALQFGQPVQPPPRRPLLQRLFPALRPAPAGAGRGQQALAALCGVTWQFESCRLGLLPTVLQFIDGNFSSGLQSLRLEQAGGGLTLFWQEGELLQLQAGLDSWAENTLTVGAEQFLVAARAQLKWDEDDQPVLKLAVCLPEHSSARQLKLSLREGKLRLSADETPSVTGVLGAVAEQILGPGKKDPLEGLAERGYSRYLIQQIAAPLLEGEPQPAAGPPKG